MDIIEVDARRRVSLGALATADRYLIEQEPGGVLVLKPAVVLTADQYKLLDRPDILAAIVDSRASGETAARPKRAKR